MTLVFVLNKINQLKAFAPLIDEALSSDEKVEIWLDQRDVSNTTKKHEFPNEDKLPLWRSGRFPVLRNFKSLTEWKNLGESAHDSIIFSYLLPPHVKCRNQKWVHIVAAFFDSFASLKPKDMSQFDYIFLDSPYWLWFGLEYAQASYGVDANSIESSRIREKSFFFGSPQYDHFLVCDRSRFRKKLGIPDSAKVITVYAFETNATFWCQRIFHEPNRLVRLFYVMTLPFSLPYVFSKLGKKRIGINFLKSFIDRFEYFFEAIRTPSELDVYKTIRRYCDQNGYIFVLKFRKKNPIRNFQKGIANVLIEEDTEYYPYTSAQVIHASDMLITFYSSSAAEGAVAGIPVINLVPQKGKFFINGHYQFLYKDHHKTRELMERDHYYQSNPGIYNFAGVTTSVSVQNFENYLFQKKIDEHGASPERRKEYIQQFINPVAAQPSAKLILRKLKELTT